MKKFISLFLVLVMALSIVACNGTTAEEENTTSVETVNPIEEAKTKLEEAFEVCCTGVGKDDYARLGYDKLSLTIDSKPDDSYFRYEDDAISAIVNVNAYLGLPSSLSDKMSSTRALDGMQTQNCGTYTVTWNYHPDNGMKVIYEVNP